MTIARIRELLDARVLTGDDHLDADIAVACGCDLMSDVLAFAKENMALLTGLTNQHSVRTAEMLDVRLVVYVRGKQPTPDVVEMAAERDIALLATDLTLFNACGMLYANGMAGDSKG
ncbi:MAG: hypothetical protein GX558_04650 [Clostridiales bacterium]|nr:hypothetical protein [Clostridiales bacterium]